MHDLNLLGTEIEIERGNNLTSLKSSIITKGNLNLKEINKISLLFGINNTYLKNLKDLSGEINLKTDASFLFDKFYRVSTGNIHNVKGFGLGLYYVNEMMQKHNGKIDIDSKINQGTTVTLTFAK